MTPTAVSDANTLVLDDGTPVRVGDRVWVVHEGYALVTRSKVRRHWFTLWHAMMVGRLFATERAALAFALYEAEQRMKKAKAKLQSERRTVLRLKKRIACKEAK